MAYRDTASVFSRPYCVTGRSAHVLIVATLVDHFVGHLIQDVKMRNLKGANDVDRHGHHVVGACQPVLTSELTARRPQHTQDLGAVETLTFTVLTKTHGPSYSYDVSERRCSLSLRRGVPVQEKSEYKPWVFSVVKSNVSSWHRVLPRDRTWTTPWMTLNRFERMAC